MSKSTSAHKRQLTYSIVYGFLGGPAHGRELLSALKDIGLKPVRETEAADIIIAHSAGCWLIPARSTARLVIFIGMPLAQDNPAKTFREANLQNIRTSLKGQNIIAWFRGLVLDLYYAVMQPKRNWLIIRRARNVQPVILPEAAHVFIANRYDPWLRSKQLDKLLDSGNWSFINLPGSHADIWKNPEHYASIINHYARLLAQANA